MKRVYANLALIFALTISIVACEESSTTDNGTSLVDKVALSFTSSIVHNEQFYEGDSLSILAVDESNTLKICAIYSCESDSLICAEPITKGEDDYFKYIAIYPNVKLESISSDIVFTVESDQSTDDGCKASKLYVAVSDFTNAQEVDLEFCPVVAALNLTITGFATLETVKINVRNGLTVEDDNVTSKYSDIEAITPKKISANQYTLLAPSQQITKGTSVAIIVSEGKTYKWISDDDYNMVIGQELNLEIDIADFEEVEEGNGNGEGGESEGNGNGEGGESEGNGNGEGGESEGNGNGNGEGGESEGNGNGEGGESEGNGNGEGGESEGNGEGGESEGNGNGEGGESEGNGNGEGEGNGGEIIESVIEINVANLQSATNISNPTNGKDYGLANPEVYEDFTFTFSSTEKALWYTQNSWVLYIYEDVNFVIKVSDGSEINKIEFSAADFEVLSGGGVMDNDANCWQGDGSAAITFKANNFTRITSMKIYTKTEK